MIDSTGLEHIGVTLICVIVGYQRLDEMPPDEIVGERAAFDEMANKRRRTHEAFPSVYRNLVGHVLATI